MPATDVRLRAAGSDGPADVRLYSLETDAASALSVHLRPTTGVADVWLAALAVAAGVASASLSAPSASSAGRAEYLGVVSAGLDGVSGSAAGLASVLGTVSRPLAGPTCTAVGAAQVIGTAAPTLRAVASSASGVLACHGAVSAALAGPSCVAAGRVGADATGAVSAALPALRCVAVARAGAPAPTGTRATLTLASSVASAAVAASDATASLTSSAATAAVAASTATATVAASAATAEVSMTYVLVEGDTLPLLTATLAVDGVATNLSGATVALRWSIAGATGTVEGTVTNAAAGECSFDCSALPAGRGTGEVRVVFADTNVRTYPSAAPFTLVVREAL